MDEGLPVNEYACVTATSSLGQGVKLREVHQPDGCTVGDETKLGAFVEIRERHDWPALQDLEPHLYLRGREHEDEVFIGHGVMFTNDTYPRATAGGALQTANDWKVEPTLVKKGASIGSGATILCNVVIGEHAIVGAGAVVTKDVPPGTIVAGNPARVLRSVSADQGEAQ